MRQAAVEKVIRSFPVRITVLQVSMLGVNR